MAIMDGNQHLQPDYNAPRKYPQGPSEEELRRWYEEDRAARRADLERQRQMAAQQPQYMYDMGGVGAGGSFDGPYMMGDIPVYPYQVSQEPSRLEQLYRYFMAARQ